MKIRENSLVLFGEKGKEWRNQYMNKFAGKKILVTGATGLIGGHLARTMVDLGGEVYGLGRTASTDTLPDGVQPVQADLRNLESTEAAFKKVKADLVVHLAHLVLTVPDIEAVWPNVETNIVGSVNLLLATQKVGCERLLFSNFPKEYIQLENNNVPFSPHCASKTAATTFARMFHYLYDVPAVIVNPYYTYGPYANTTKLVPSTILSFLRNEPPKVSTGEQYIEPAFVDDCIRGMIIAATGPNSLVGETLDFTSGKARRVRDIVEDIRRVMNTDIKPEYGAEAKRYGDKDIMVKPGTLERTTELCGWKPIWSWEESLKFTVDWIRENQLNKS